MASNMIITPVLNLPAIFYPMGSHSPLKGTIEDETGSPLQRVVSAYREDPVTGLAGWERNILSNIKTTSNPDGTFTLPVNENKLPITIVIHGEEGENDKIIKGIKIP